MKTYQVNEVFYSLQGEGVRAGTPNVFVRFAGCNMRCAMEPGEKSPGGFDCDTEFQSSRKVSLMELEQWIDKSIDISLGKQLDLGPQWLILTGGEPGLQVDKEFIDHFHTSGYRLAIETNGSIALPTLVPLGPNDNWKDNQLIDWITLSPKVAEHAIKQLWANELKYVRGYGQGIPKPAAKAEHYLISPAFDGGIVHPETMKWCQKLVLENPQWRLSCQQHKMWNVR